jgi:hypothetical protein
VIYDSPGRIVRTLGLEDEVKLVMVNAPHVEGEQGPQQVDPMAAQMLKNVQHFDLSQGTYGVRVSPGTSYTTRKQEAAEWQLRLIEARPEMMQVFGDIAVRNMDGPGHEQIADRIERTIPPQIKGDQDQQPDPAALQAQMAQAQQVMQAMQGKIAEQQQLIDTQGIKASADLTKAREDNAAKMRIEQMKAEVAALQARVELLKTQVTVDADLAKANIDAETKRLLKLADLDGQRESAEHEAYERDKDRAVASTETVQ